MNILMLFDLSTKIAESSYTEMLKTEEWKTEAHVLKALQKLGHGVTPLGVQDDLEGLIHQLKSQKPDLVFNLSEAFRGRREYEPHLVSLLELMEFKYTGAGPEALRLCKDKSMTKKILAYHRIAVPRFEVSRIASPLRNLKGFDFPAFIKPLELEASEGISQVSFAATEKDALERVQYIHERYNVDAIIEEYIEGRELYVSVLGNEKLTVFAPRELFFREVPEDEPRFATFRAKWNENYRKKWGIDTGFASTRDEAFIEKLTETCKKIYRVLKLKGYGRIDLRIRPNGEIVFIEANPNPSIAKDDDFALSANKSGLDYESLLSKIVSLSGA